MENPKILVRTASPSDISTLAEFQVQMALETESLTLDPGTVTRGVTAVFEKSTPAAAGGQYYIAYDRTTGKTAGCTLVLNEWSDWRNGTVWWIHSVYVRPEYRKSGVFRALYDYLQERVKQDPGLRGLRLYVDRTNHRAQEVYSKLGMNGEHYKLFEWMKEF